MDTKPKDNITGAWFFGIMGTVILAPYWYAALQFDPPFRMMGGRDVTGSPGSYLFGTLLFALAAYLWVRNWHRILQKVRGSAATALIITTILALTSLVNVFLLSKSLIFIDLNSYLSGEHPTQWYAWRENLQTGGDTSRLEGETVSPRRELSNFVVQIRCGVDGGAPTQVCDATVTKDTGWQGGKLMMVQMPNGTWRYITFQGTTPTQIRRAGRNEQAVENPAFSRHGKFTTIRYGSDTFVVADGHVTGW